MAKKLKNPWFVYLLECLNGKLYTGIAINVEARFAMHSLGKGAKFTKSNPPSHIVGVRICKNRSEASKLEIAMKRLTPAKKREAVAAWPALKAKKD